MCLIDCCFRPLGNGPQGATKEERVSHYRNKALCALVIGLISTFCLISSAYSMITPLTVGEWVSLGIYAVIAVACFAKTWVDGNQAWKESQKTDNEPQINYYPQYNRVLTL